MSSISLLQFFVIFSVSLASVYSYDNGISLKPPLGWNTWCTQGKCMYDVCDENEIKSIANAMLENGMFDLGYDYINLDDCWAYYYRNETTNALRWDPDRFPNGLPSLIDWLHQRGFKFGLYTSAGDTTCSPGQRPYDIPGSYNYYKEDTAAFAEWGVDFVKIDWCGDKDLLKSLDPQVMHSNFSQWLNATGRPIHLELCRGYDYPPPPYVADVAQSWRVSGDHVDNWGSTLDVISHLVGVSDMSGPYRWSYADFLETGGQGCKGDWNESAGSHCPGMEDEMYKSFFAITAFSASPLIVATDVRNLTAVMKECLFNTNFLTINQDYEAPAGDVIATWAYNQEIDEYQITWRNDAPQDNEICNSLTDCYNVADLSLWSRKLSDGTIATALFNQNANETVSIDLDFTLWDWKETTIAQVKDLWTSTNHKSEPTGKFNVKVPQYAVAANQFTPIPDKFESNVKYSYTNMKF